MIISVISGKESRDQLNHYNLVVFLNVQLIKADQVVEAVTQDDDYQYFIYESQCKDDCSIVVGVQALSGGDPDLYINYGDQQELPDKLLADIKSNN